MRPGRRPSGPRSAGFSLVEVLVASAVLGILVAAIATGLTHVGKATRSAQLRDEYEEVRRFLRADLSCRQTLYQGGTTSLCPTSGYLQGVANDGSSLIAPTASGTVLADHYHIRISCYPGATDRLLIEAARYDSASQRITADPLTGRPFAWQDLFNRIPVECAPEPDPCATGSGGSLIDFEQLPDGTTPAAGLTISDQYWQSQGVSFQFADGSYPRIVQVDDPNTYAWQCWANGMPSGTPACSSQYNGLRGNQGVGRFLIGEPAATAFAATPSPLLITYKQPVKQAGFSIMDIDGDEHWDVDALDAQGNVLATVSAEASPTNSVNYRDGMMTYFSVPPVKLASAQIWTLRLRGRSSGGFGLAFDGFSTAGVCPSRQSTFGPGSTQPWWP